MDPQAEHIILHRLSPFQFWVRSDTPSSRCKLIIPPVSKPKSNIETGIQRVGNTHAMQNVLRLPLGFLHAPYICSFSCNLGRRVQQCMLRFMSTLCSQRMAQHVGNTKHSMAHHAMYEHSTVEHIMTLCSIPNTIVQRTHVANKTHSNKPDGTTLSLLYCHS